MINYTPPLSEKDANQFSQYIDKEFSELVSEIDETIGAHAGSSHLKRIALGVVGSARACDAFSLMEDVAQLGKMREAWSSRLSLDAKDLLDSYILNTFEAAESLLYHSCGLSNKRSKISDIRPGPA